MYIFKGEIDLTSNIFLKIPSYQGIFLRLQKAILIRKYFFKFVTFYFENENKIFSGDKEKMFSVAAQKYHFDVDYQKFLKIFCLFHRCVKDK